MKKQFYYFKPIIDFYVTLVCWLYYTLGFIIFFAPLYLFCILFKADKEITFQKLNYHFYRIFFRLLTFITPSLRINIDDDVKNISSSIIVSNHISYLDPLIYISIYAKHKTIVKEMFFKLPVFASVLKHSGYIPSTSHGNFSYLTIQQMENIDIFFQKGGNLFIFPEGTRGRADSPLTFYSGAFKIARRHNIPINVVYIRDSDVLFPPGKMIFNTCIIDTISVELLGTVYPRLEDKKRSVSDLKCQVQQLLYSQA